MKPAAALLALAACAVPAFGAERAIEKETVLAATLDQAWEAWTTRDGIRAFFAPDANVDARPGGPFEIYIDPGAAPGLKGADDMRFLAVQPKKMISFTWNAPPHLPEARAQRTVVVVRFVPVDEKQTRITLHHTAWGDGGEWDKAYAYFDRAWGGVLANLKKRFEQGPQDWTAWLEQLKRMREGQAAGAGGATK